MNELVVFTPPPPPPPFSYIWLPITIDETTKNASIAWRWEWTPADPFGPVPPPPPPPPPPPCESDPAAVRLSLSPCNASDPHQQWTVQSTAVASVGFSSQCIGLSGTDNHTAKPGLGLVGCSSARFSYDSTASQIRTSDSVCADVTWCGGSVCDGRFVATYPCSDTTHHNQQFALDSSTRQFHVGFDASLCLTACSRYACAPALSSRSGAVHVDHHPLPFKPM